MATSQELRILAKYLKEKAVDVTYLVSGRDKSQLI